MRDVDAECARIREHLHRSLGQKVRQAKVKIARDGAAARTRFDGRLFIPISIPGKIFVYQEQLNLQLRAIIDDIAKRGVGMYRVDPGEIYCGSSGGLWI